MIARTIRRARFAVEWWWYGRKLGYHLTDCWEMAQHARGVAREEDLLEPSTLS